MYVHNITLNLQFKVATYVRFDRFGLYFLMCNKLYAIIIILPIIKKLT